MFEALCARESESGLCLDGLAFECEIFSSDWGSTEDRLC
jgi:hypothetical protein